MSNRTLFQSLETALYNVLSPLLVPEEAATYHDGTRGVDNVPAARGLGIN